MIGGMESVRVRRRPAAKAARVSKPKRRVHAAMGPNKRRSRMKSRLDAALAVVLAFALSPFGSVIAYANGDGSADAKAAGDSSVVVDASTMDGWKDIIGTDTANVGRIWTDKSVFSDDVVFTGSGMVDPVTKGSSTFTTVLSALSSTSNLRATATSPLDIVLVLDASGSMDEDLGSGSSSTTRIEALKNAGDSFIDEIAKQNASVSDASKQHQVAIVKFASNRSNSIGNDRDRNGYNYSQAMKNMVACTDKTKADFKTQIDAIRPGGATRADLGLDLAAGQTSGRADAKKVVVFFTDGSPTSSNGFENATASEAVAKAKALKDAGASVYAVGIFDGADPSADPLSSETSNTNKFMQAVSSNYPNATYTQVRRNYTWSFGTRAQNSNFYKSATNAEDLKTVFDDISQEIVHDAGFPTEVRSGYEDQSGYVTFTDQLGDYMQVDDFKAIVFADKKFENPVKTTNGLVDTYTFEGEAGNVLYPDGNLDSVSITVARSDSARTGDVVEVKIPASLIPLRHFEIDQNEGRGSVTSTYPIRICYGSSLKAGVADELANPGEELSAYIDANTADGRVSFLANKWSGTDAGDSIAAFTPSKANGYYYITADTPIYADAACTQRAAYPLGEKGETYYYQRLWYDITASGAAVEKTTVVSFTGDSLENLNGYISRDADGLAYFKAGTPRMTYIDELHFDKGAGNATSTAASSTDPRWAGTAVNVHLGNNGKLSAEGPGTLSVTKTVQVPEGFDAAAYEGREFEFELQLPASYVGKTLVGEVVDVQGEAFGETELTFTAQANLGAATTARASFWLCPGQTLYVRGLSAGDAYKVVETDANQGGFTTTSSGDIGTISAFGVSAAAFANSYSATGVLDGALNLKGRKLLSGRDWNDTDKFAFLITATAGAPLPQNTVVEVTRANVSPDGTAFFNFGDITYAKPGVYEYEIRELNAGQGFDGSINVNAGVSVSQARYHVEVTVADNGDGTLAASSVMTQVANDAGAKAEGEVSQAAFTNAFNAESEDWSLHGQKRYEDKSGENPLASGMFQFELSAIGDAPLPADARDGKAVAANDATGAFSFGSITFTTFDIGKTYRYELREVEPSGHVPAMSYDTSVWDVEVAVSATEVDGRAVVVVSPTYAKRGDASSASGQESPSFTNVYAPQSAVVEGFAAGTKTLAGRDSLQNESFDFALSQVSGPEGGVSIERTSVSVTGLENGVPKAFDFGKATFAKPGTYVFEIREIVPQPGASGVTYDTHECLVGVSVVDRAGVLHVMETTYSDATSDAPGASFTNVYRVKSQAYAGLNVSKTLVGRTMAEGEFSFAIRGIATETATAEQASALLADSDKLFSNDEQKASGVACIMKKMTGITFTAGDIGKTYGYEISEVVPAQGALPGVAYDSGVHRVLITVSDNLAGELVVTTRVDDDRTSDVAFVNRYRAADTEYDTARAGFNKVLEGRDWADGDAFEFVLTAEDGAPLPVDQNGQPVTKITVTRENASNFSFGTIVFTPDDMKVGNAVVSDRTFVYRVSETPGDAEGITYSASVALVKVRVVDDGAGALNATAEVEGASFTNVYREFADNEVPIVASKTVAGNPTEDFTGRFRFTLSALDGGPLPETTEVTNDVNGLVNFGKIVFTPSVFELEPVAGESDREAGRSAEGALGASALEGPADAIEVPGAGASAEVPSAAIAPQAAQASGASAPDEVAPEGEPAASGDVRTFLYSITEQPSGIDNIADDPMPTITFEVTVARDAQGSISAQITRMWKASGAAGEATAVTSSKGAPIHAFVNTFTPPVTPPPASDPEPAFAAPSAKKLLEGRDLAAGEFSFELLEGGKVVATAKNTADGLVAFPAIKYTEAGEHTYIVREVNNGAENVVYDTSTFRVAVAVSESDGKLVASVSCPDGDPVFTNRYVEPKPVPVSDPIDPTPTPDDSQDVRPEGRAVPLGKTGDGTPFAIALAIALAATGGVAVAVSRIARKRGESN